MRDHPWHGVTFLAGLWSAKLYQPYIRKKMKESMTAIIEDEKLAYNSRKEKMVDMFLLQR